MTTANPHVCSVHNARVWAQYSSCSAGYRLTACAHLLALSPDISEETSANVQQADQQARLALLPVPLTKPPLPGLMQWGKTHHLPQLDTHFACNFCTADLVHL